MVDKRDEFLDEKILEYRRLARKVQYSNLDTGMYIQDELVQFERVDLFQKKMSIMLPTTFVNLPSNLAKLKYSSEQRPQIIKTSLDTTVNIGFNLINEKLLDSQIEALMIQIKSALKRMNPAFPFFDSRIEKEPIALGWFEFKNFGYDKDVYNLMFITRIDGKALHGVFNCPYEDALEWRDAAHQMMASIKDHTRKDGENERAENHS